MKKIFFSYCWDDKEAFDFIEKFIKKNNLKEEDFFLDIRKNKLGDHYWENIRDELEGSGYFIYFNSINYYKSSACCKEYIWALSIEQSEGNIKLIEIKMDKQSKLYQSSNDRVYYDFANNTKEQLMIVLNKVLEIDKTEVIEIIEIRNDYYNDGIFVKFKALVNIKYIYFFLKHNKNSYINYSISREIINFMLDNKKHLVYSSELIQNGKDIKINKKKYWIWNNEIKLNLSKNNEYWIYIKNTDISYSHYYFTFSENKNEIKKSKLYNFKYHD